MDPGTGWLIGLIIVFAIVSFWAARMLTKIKFRKREKEARRKRLRGLKKGTLEVTPEEFFEIRKRKKRGRGRVKNFAGVYILYNRTKNKYYVGQGKQVLSRVNSHFMGRGNGDVYADYKYGDKFTIKMIALKKSGYKSLNALERDMIAAYDAFAHGYNKTRGNK